MMGWGAIVQYLSWLIGASSPGSLISGIHVRRGVLVCDDASALAFFYSICSLGFSFPLMSPSLSLLF